MLTAPDNIYVCFVHVSLWYCKCNKRNRASVCGFFRELTDILLICTCITGIIAE